MALLDRDKRYDVDGNGCWIWTGPLDRDGYGKMSMGTGAHRKFYEHYVGPIPAGLTIDHLCRVKACVNPAHMEPVTARENNLRGDTIYGRNARKTHCVNGHEFSAENTRRDPDGARVCKACSRAAKRRYLDRKKEATDA
jgi:hypothetical protein